MSPFSAPFSGAPKSEGCCFQSERLRYGRVSAASRSGNRTFRVNVATSILYAVADLFLVNIQSDVIHSLHGESLLGCLSESARSLSSAFVHQALLLTYTFKQIRSESAEREVQHREFGSLYAAASNG